MLTKGDEERQDYRIFRHTVVFNTVMGIRFDSLSFLLVMGRLRVFLGCALMLLCLCGHGFPAFALENSCVDEATLKDFYDKFGLLEQEKEALRNKLATCISGADKAGELAVPLSQKDGRQLRYLESKIAQLQEENNRLKDKLKALGTDAGGEQAAAETANMVTNDPVLSEGASQGALENVVAPERAESSSERGIPVPRTKPVHGSVHPDDAAEDKKSDRSVPAPEVAPELIETGSGGPVDPDQAIVWNTSQPMRAEAVPPVKSSFEDGCASRYQAFSDKISALAADHGERQTLKELFAQRRALLLAKSGSKNGFLCPDQTAADNVLHMIAEAESALGQAENGQQAIQMLYYNNKKLESSP